MRTLRLIYLAAPLSASDVGRRWQHLYAAQALRDALESDPYAMVYLPHERIARQYGYPNEDETPATRAAALDQCMAALRMIYGARGELHILAFPNGALSIGCQAEHDHWIELGGDRPIIWMTTDTGWVSVCGRYGMSR